MSKQDAERLVADALRALVVELGLERIHAGSLRGLLADRLGVASTECSLQLRLVTDALSSGVVDALQRGESPDAVAIAFAERTAFQSEAASWATDAWSGALAAAAPGRAAASPSTASPARVSPLRAEVTPAAATELPTVATQLPGATALPPPPAAPASVRPAAGGASGPPTRSGSLGKRQRAVDDWMRSHLPDAGAPDIVIWNTVSNLLVQVVVLAGVAGLLIGLALGYPPVFPGFAIILVFLLTTKRSHLVATDREVVVVQAGMSGKAKAVDVRYPLTGTGADGRTGVLFDRVTIGVDGPRRRYVPRRQRPEVDALLARLGEVRRPAEASGRLRAAALAVLVIGVQVGLGALLDPNDDPIGIASGSSTSTTDGSREDPAGSTDGSTDTTKPSSAKTKITYCDETLRQSYDTAFGLTFEAEEQPEDEQCAYRSDDLTIYREITKSEDTPTDFLDFGKGYCDEGTYQEITYEDRDAAYGCLTDGDPEVNQLIDDDDFQVEIVAFIDGAQDPNAVLTTLMQVG
jgi:hypothetical protein